jgi:hypothetical protein
VEFFNAASISNAAVETSYSAKPEKPMVKVGLLQVTMGLFLF